MSETTVTIVIPARNARRSLGSVLHDIAASAPPSVDVVVVDDGSSDGTADVALGFRDRLPRLRVIRGEGRGPAAARNAGIRAADSEWVAFTDADVRVPPGWFGAGLRAAMGEVDVLEGPVTPRGGAEQGLVRHSAWSDGQRRYVTANLWVRRSALDEVGGFDEAYPSPWREDTDLGLRLEDVGARVVTVPDMQIFHPYYRGSVWSLFGQTARIHADTRFRKKFGARTRYVMPSRTLNRSYITTAYLVATLGVVALRPVLWTAVPMIVGTTELAAWATRMFLEHPSDSDWRERALFVVIAPALVLWRVSVAMWSNVRHRTLFL